MRELENLGWSVKIVNIKDTPPTRDEIQEWLSSDHLPIKQLFNTSGQVYRELGLKDKLQQMSQEEAVQLLASNGMLIKRPLLVKDHHLLQVGYRTPYQALEENKKR
ncbi:Arsenate reductase [Streptococcus sp. DD13]|nr:Arsenate reductase [Streptococcus sp. DD13]